MTPLTESTIEDWSTHPLKLMRSEVRVNYNS